MRMDRVKEVQKEKHIIHDSIPPINGDLIRNHTLKGLKIVPCKIRFARDQEENKKIAIFIMLLIL
jgi:hypothetical protein